MEKTNYKELIAVLILYAIMLYVWSIPIMSNHVPYGETDAAIHYMTADAIYTDNKVDLQMPNGNPDAGYTRLIRDKLVINEYPPSFYSGIAMMKFFFEERNVSMYLYILLTNSILFLTLYLLIRKMYGYKEALLASLLVIFSLRSILTFLWGQWTTGAAISLFPLVMYSLYKYYNNQVTSNAILLAMVTAFTFLLHPAVGVFTIFCILIALILLSLSTMKYAMSIKHAIIIVIIFGALFVCCAPYQSAAISSRIFSNLYKTTDNVDASHSFPLIANPPSALERVFGWYNLPYNLVNNYPPVLFQYQSIYFGYWSLPFLLIAVGLFIWRRKPEDLILLSTLFAFYIITHTDIVGWYLDTKVVRLFYIESVLFFPFIAVGAIWLLSLIPHKVTVTVSFVLLMFGVFMYLSGPTYDTFKSAYPDRLNPSQYAAADWIYHNLPRDAKVAYIGIPTFPQRSWFQSISQRYGVFTKDVVPSNISGAEYMVIDYSWYYAQGNQEAINALDQFPRLNRQPLNSDTYVQIYNVTMV